MAYDIRSRCLINPNAWNNAFVFREMCTDQSARCIPAFAVCGERKVLRLRGGMDNPSADKTSAKVPYLDNIKFMWDGHPCIEFDEKGLATNHAWFSNCLC